MKRIQVQLRPVMYPLVEALAEKSDISMSKMVSQLVEEALAHRGVIGNQAPAAVAKPSPDDLTAEDLVLLKKLKALKELGL